MTDDPRESIHSFVLAPRESLLKRNLDERGLGSGSTKVNVDVGTYVTLVQSLSKLNNKFDNILYRTNTRSDDFHPNCHQALCSNSAWPR
jgi:hypothetical protein